MKIGYLFVFLLISLFIIISMKENRLYNATINIQDKTDILSFFEIVV